MTGLQIYQFLNWSEIETGPPVQQANQRKKSIKIEVSLHELRMDMHKNI